MIIGCIGTGTMGSAVMLAAASAAPDAVFLLSNRTAAKAEALKSRLPRAEVLDNAAVAARAEWIFLCVKPQVMPLVLSELAPVLQSRTDRFVLVSMAAGLTIETLRAMAGGRYPMIRMMPNTPVSVGAGVVTYCTDGVTDAESAAFVRLLSPCGLLDPLNEHLIDAASAVAGCGPAFVDLFLEALADGGVACGLPRSKAILYAAQMTEGAAQMAKESGTHPGALKDAVCSPGGSTIQGVRALEAGGLRSAVIEAVIAAYEKNRALGNA